MCTFLLATCLRFLDAHEMRTGGNIHASKPRRRGRHVVFRLDDATNADSANSHHAAGNSVCAGRHTGAPSCTPPHRSPTLRSESGVTKDSNHNCHGGKSAVVSTSFCGSSWSRTSRAETEALRELAMERGRDVARVVSGLGFEVVTRPETSMTWLATTPLAHTSAGRDDILQLGELELRCQSRHENRVGSSLNYKRVQYGEDDSRPSSYWDAMQYIGRQRRDYKAPCSGAAPALADCAAAEASLMQSWRTSSSESRAGSELSDFQDVLLTPFFPDGSHNSNNVGQRAAPTGARVKSTASTSATTPAVRGEAAEHEMCAASAPVPIAAMARARSDEGHDSGVVDESPSGQTPNTYNYVLFSPRSNRSNSSDSVHWFNPTNTIARLNNSAHDNVSTSTSDSRSGGGGSSSVTTDNSGHGVARNNINRSSIMSTTRSGRVPMDAHELTPYSSTLSAPV